MKDTKEKSTLHISFTEDDMQMYHRLIELKNESSINLSSLIRKFIKRGLENES